MNTRGFAAYLYKLTEWIMRLAYINLLWIFYTVIGVVILGFFPSTAALYTVIRQWVKNDTELSIWKIYKRTYKANFFKANAVGYPFLTAGCIILFDLKLFQSYESVLFSLLANTFFILLIIYTIMWLFLFPVFVHYELKFFQYWKQTFLIVMLRPFEASLTVAGLFAVYYFMSYIPLLIIFFGCSVFASITMLTAYRAFIKLQSKTEDKRDDYKYNTG